jgi:hypothetical protein
MNKRIDFAQLGGLPISQNTLNFLQQSYREAFAWLSIFFGDFVIVSGVNDLGATYSDGWMAINGELIPFIGGTKSTNVVITETVTSKLFADGNTKNVWYTRTASCASSGGTPFANFVRLNSAKQDQANLAAELVARANADTTLQNNINAEITARSNADTTLQNNINSLNTTLQGNINNLIDTNRPWVSVGSLGAGWTGTMEYKLTGRGTVKFRGVITKSSPSTGETIVTLPVPIRSATRITHAMGNSSFLAGAAIFLDLLFGVLTIYQSGVSSGAISGATLNMISFPEYEV